MRNRFGEINLVLGVMLVTALLSACAPKQKPRELDFEEKIASDTIFPQDPNMIRTSQGARALDLETPLRCYVNWKTQEMITSIPYNVKAFNLVSNKKNDIICKYSKQ